MSRKNQRKHIYVYADWLGLEGPQLVGTLSVDAVKGSEIFSFSYDKTWLSKGFSQSLDPDLQLFSGEQYASQGKINFGVFTDSCPDRWGRLLIKKREAILARQEGRTPKAFFESDFLLSVFDGNRLGALRFKTDPSGEFLDNNSELACPPWARLRELEHASLNLEKDDDTLSDDHLKWLNMLISPGSSLGGARPKASILDEEQNLWIAKFPSRYDDVDIGAWEYVAYKIATEAGISMSTCHAKKFTNFGHTFLTKRFDRLKEKRIHFASAMTCLGKVDGDDHKAGASYLDLAAFLTRYGSRTSEDLEELWRRIVLNLFVSNTDDHLRNHGFILEDSGWRLSPAFDINPTADGRGFKLNISEDDNSLSLELALSVASHFRLSEPKAKSIMEKVKLAASKWRQHAANSHISKSKQDLMAQAFRLTGVG